MAEKFFNRYEISPAFKHVCSEGVSEGMGVRGVDTSTQTDLLNDSVEVARPQPTL
jgi:hypothetical protein